MKVLLVAINAKYIHSNLAVFSLRRYAERHTGAEVEIAEYTINQPQGKILADIMRRDADLIAFSCYIWNIECVRSLVSDIGKIRPEVDIWLGGPEVSQDAERALEVMPVAKGVIRGEGERAFAGLIREYEKGAERFETLDITWRCKGHNLVKNPPGERMSFDEIEFPYEDLKDFDNRIIYYESSRGCPFRCSYCLSSVDKALAFRSVEKVKEELDFFIERKVPQVKFIDRTFNCEHGRTMAIWEYIREHDNGSTNFHFEIAADIMTDEEIEVLGKMRPGALQLEIGVQSTNEQTIREINRPMDFAKVSRVVKRILEPGNVHVHLDLIAGLPYEDAASFRKSFNDVFALRPHQLQLGFLKVLKGSPIAAKCEEYGLAFTDLPPYEVLKTNWISYAELAKLKAAEEMVDSYYNSGQFGNALEFLLEHCFGGDEFGVFEGLAQWYEARGIEKLNLSRNSKYESLLEFGLGLLEDEADRQAFRDAIALDYYLRDNVRSRPEFLGPETVSKAFLKEYYAGFEDSRAARASTHIERIGGELIVFDYSKRDAVSGNVSWTRLESMEFADIG